MASESDYLLLAAFIVGHRWLSAWAACQLRQALLLAVGLIALIVAVTPLLITVSAVTVQQSLMPYLSVLAILVCIEASLLYRLAPLFVCLSPVSLMGLSYLLLMLFQSGSLMVSFEVQATIYFLGLLLLYLLYRFPLQHEGLFQRSVLFHAVLLWGLSWLSFGEWPESSGRDSRAYAIDSLLLMGIMLLLAAVHFALTPLLNRLRGK